MNRDRDRDRDHDDRYPRHGRWHDGDRSGGRLSNNEGKRDNFDRDRDRDRSDRREYQRRSRSPNRRSNSRDRKRVRSEHTDDHYGPGSSSNRAPNAAEPSLTVVLKGLPNHTTEPTLNSVLAQFYPKEIRLIMQRDGDCKGYAFVEFPSLEYSQYFMTTYAGSAGDRNAPQLIIENRAVLIEYARGDNDKGREPRDRDAARGNAGRNVKSDWLCDTCHCHNFSRRDSCFRCSSARTEHSVCVASGSVAPPGGLHADAFSDAATDTPCAFLLVRGLSPVMSEEQVNEVFRQFALVKHVSLIRDPATHYSKGLAFVEFFTVEHAQYALQCTHRMALNTRDVAVSGDTSLHVTFAKESVMHAMLRKALQPGHVLAVNPLVTQALQAAQWSANNGYSTAVPPSNPQPPASLGAPPAPRAPPAHAFSHTAGNLQYGTALSPPGYPPDMQGLPQYAVAPPAKPAPRWPPHFETNGGQYVYQASSGCFFNAATEFFYDPKSHLYYSARDGVYLNYDSSVQPPFKLFIPPEPTAMPLTVEATQRNDSQASHTTSTIATSSITAPSTVPAAQQGKVKMGLTAGATGNKPGAVGFGGFGLAGSKKVKIDLAKWGALQQEEEQEPPVPAKEGKASESAAKSTQEVVRPPTEMVGAVKTDSMPGARSEQLRSRENQDTSGAAGATIHASLPPVVKAVIVTEDTKASRPPPAIPAPAPAPVISIPALAPVCLLCQRQFASFEMLQRHEKESKLHADNMKKLVLQ